MTPLEKLTAGNNNTWLGDDLAKALFSSLMMFHIRFFPVVNSNFPLPVLLNHTGFWGDSFWMIPYQKADDMC